jgi:hypothetical protein
MNERQERPRTRVAFGAVPYAAALAALVACGGQSIRHVDDGAAGEPSDPPPRGGASNGGRGGSGAVDPGGGSFTGGASSGGSIAIGGTGPGGTGGTGGSIAIGGTGAVGTGGVGTGGCGGVGGPVSIAPLSFGNDGIIHPGSNPFGISGGWYSFDDCADATAAGLPCTQREPSLLGPDGLTGWTTQSDRACASGTAARVELGPDGAPAYGLQWGFGLGVSLNQGAPWNAPNSCVTGFVIELLGTAPATLRINIVTPRTIGVSHFVEVPLGGNVIVDFATVRQGPWVTNPTPLDPTQITDLQFHVYTNEQARVPYHFCAGDIHPF